MSNLSDDIRIETIPEEQLGVDLIHRAVRRMLVGDEREPPTAPTVRIVNLAIGDPHQPFDHALSPLARLLDSLSTEHNILFIVAAGNYGENIALGVTEIEFNEAANNGGIDHLILGAIRRDARNRRILSPAESVNSLTVGATNQDFAGAIVAREIRFFNVPTGPNPINRLGFGYRRSIKPDVLAAGGRQAFRRPGTLRDRDNVELTPVLTMSQPGVAHAFPGGAGRLDEIVYSTGTSNATAAVTHLAGQVYDQIEALGVPDSHRTVATKALIGHAAS